MRFPRFIISFFLLAIGTSCNGENIGLCLSGGGAKGAYEIGVMKAIEEKNLSPNIKSISGTSVGALNGTLFASVGAEEAEKLWKERISFYEVLTPDEKKDEETDGFFRNLLNSIIPGDGQEEAFQTTINTIDSTLFGTAPIKGLYSRKQLKSLIDETVDFEKLKKSPVKLYATALRKEGLVNQFLASGQADFSHTFYLNEQTTKEAVSSILLASSAIPFVFDSVRLPPETLENGQFVDFHYTYFDGGTYFLGGQNTPIYPLLKDKTLDTIIIIYVDSSQELNGVNRSFRKLVEDSGKKLIEIIPSKSLGDFLTGSMNFSDKHIEKLIQLGYNDAMSVLK